MNPIYKFTLSANGGAEQQAFPVYRNDLSKDFELQSNEQFYRAKLSGKLTFIADDYSFIVAQSFDTQFGLKIYISYDAGQTWTEYWTGEFWKTNCTFNVDDQTVTLTPDVKDQYTAVLAGLEKEFNLIELAPEIKPVGLLKRPCLQIYIHGNTSIGQIMFGNNTYWETECDSFNPGSHHFGSVSDWYPISIGFFDVGAPTESTPLFSTTPLLGNDNINYGAYTLQITAVGSAYDIILTRNADGAQWRNNNAPQYSLATLDAVAGTGADYAHVDLSTLASVNVSGRIIFDLDSSGGHTIGQNDPVFNNRNYKYCIEIFDPINNLVALSGNLSDTPTPYGINSNGKYYDKPNTTGHWVPMAQNSWGAYSVWLNVDVFLSELGHYDTELSEENTLRHAYPIASVISVLLAQIAPELTHQGTMDYSRFLYGYNPISYIWQDLFITPKSNVLTLGYDTPAQKAPITLKRVLDMLRDCFRCYWFVDDQNRFRIEHIEYFRRGGAYTGTPVIGRDLTVEQVTQNGKNWAFGTSKYQFDKPEMAARYQFGWMDDVTLLFEGYPIDIISKYVNPDNIEEINVAQFSSDIDYILLAPDDISKDGFVLLATRLTAAGYHIATIDIEDGGVTHKLQNGRVSFAFLQQYYAYDMPALHYSINGNNETALGVKRLKTQTLKFPAHTDPDTLRLIKTNLGNGTIQKMSVNLSSRIANTTLKYDTE